MLFVIEGTMLGETIVPTEVIHEVAVRGYEDLDTTDTLLLAQRLQQGGSRSHSRSPEDDVTYSRVVDIGGGVNFQRSVRSGNTVNIACVVMLWNRCIETVTAQVPSECYAISAEDFADAFEVTVSFSPWTRHFFPLSKNMSDNLFRFFFPRFFLNAQFFFVYVCCGISKESTVVEKVLEKCVETMFHMVEDPDAPTAHGVPLFYYTGRETQERERRWEDKVAEEKQLQAMSPAVKRMSMISMQEVRVAPM